MVRCVSTPQIRSHHHPVDRDFGDWSEEDGRFPGRKTPQVCGKFRTCFPDERMPSQELGFLVEQAMDLASEIRQSFTLQLEQYDFIVLRIDCEISALARRQAFVGFG